MKALVVVVLVVVLGVVLEVVLVVVLVVVPVVVLAVVNLCGTPGKWPLLVLILPIVMVKSAKKKIGTRCALSPHAPGNAVPLF